MLVLTLSTLLALSLRPKEVLSWSTDTIRDPEFLFFTSTSVVGCQKESQESKSTPGPHKNPKIPKPLILPLAVGCVPGRRALGMEEGGSGPIAPAQKVGVALIYSNLPLLAPSQRDVAGRGGARARDKSGRGHVTKI